MFMNDEQLEDMTGYKNHHAQAKWLAENNYRFDLRSDGRPNVMVDQVRARQLGLHHEQAGHSKPGPDFSWLEKAG